MAEGDPAASHVITPGETYQIDSDEWDSDEDREALRDEEYDRLVDEGMSCPSG
jgi:NAD-dependent histone deacetylase SIR2